MPQNYQSLMLLEQHVFQAMCNAHGIKKEDMDSFEHQFAAAKAIYPDIFAPDEVAGTNIRAPHFRAYMTTQRAKSFLALELGIDLEEYEKAKKDIPQVQS